MISPLVLLCGLSVFTITNSRVVNDTTLTTNDVSRFNNMVSRISPQLDNDYWSGGYSITSIDFDDTWVYRSLFDNRGKFTLDVDISLSSGEFTFTTNSRQEYTSLVGLDDLYLIFYSSGLTSNLASTQFYYGPSDNLHLGSSTTSLDVYYDTSADNTYFRFGYTSNYVSIYKISLDSDLKYFAQSYGYNFNDTTHSISMNVYDYFQLLIRFPLISSGELYFSVYSANDLRNAYNLINAQGSIFSSGYNSGYDSGYSEGQTVGYNTGYSEGQTVGYNTGYSEGQTVGYNQGVASVSDNNSTIMGLFGAIANVPITILNSVMGPTLLGVPLITILLNFLSVLLILWLIKKFIK